MQHKQSYIELNAHLCPHLTSERSINSTLTFKKMNMVLYLHCTI